MIVESKTLRIDIHDNGHIVELTDISTGTNYRHGTMPSPLMSVRRFEDETDLQPIHMTVSKRQDQSVSLTLDYDTGITATVSLVNKGAYLTLTLVDIEPVEAIHHITWGPIRTSMTGPVAEVLGICRAETFSIGMLSLEPKTVGSSDLDHMTRDAAYYLPQEQAGSALACYAMDHTRDGMGENRIRIRAIPGLTVKGSTVALYGCPTDKELDVVERIELGEDLPHPMLGNTWAKRSPKASCSSMWLNAHETNFDDCLNVVKEVGFGTVCSFNPKPFANWGHFELSPKHWPGGMEAMRACTKKAEAAGVRFVMYTLTGFLKPIDKPEPFIAPVPDERLQTMLPETQLARALADDDTSVWLHDVPDLKECLDIPSTFKNKLWIKNSDTDRMIRVDNEFIYYDTVSRTEDGILLEGCQRGMFDTKPTPHDAGVPAVRMYLEGYRSFFPGTVDMDQEVAGHIARVALEGGFQQVTLDGHESCWQTGHGVYAMNLFLKTIYDACEARQIFHSGSRLGNYTWHMTTYTSWGEHDHAKGVRGTMLDYRLRRTVQLRRNHMPRRLGQHYLQEATAEDMDWLMGLAAGFEAGVELSVSLDDLAANPERDEIIRRMRLWEQARLDEAFTEEEKLSLRQPDRLHSLTQDQDGYHLTFVKQWRDDRLELLPASTLSITTDSEETSQPCSIDWDATHNPGIYAQAALSDDLACDISQGPTTWSVHYPGPEAASGIGMAQTLLFVMRLPDNAPGGVRHPVVTLNGQHPVLLPITLEPGQYAAVTHNFPIVRIYNKDHKLIGETHLRILHELPHIARGETHTITVSGEAVADGQSTSLITNLLWFMPIKG